MEEAPFVSVAPGAIAPDRCWWIKAADGVRLRAALWETPGAKAHAVYLTGRTEYIEKAAVPAAELKARGYSVVSLDWRGQGLSDRLSSPPEKGHVDDFTHYQLDLDALLADPVMANLAGPRLLVGHSMGGNIATAALARPEISGPLTASVLSAPMLEIAMSGPMRVLAGISIVIARLLGRLERWPPIGDMSTTYALSDPEENLLTSDPAIWDWMVEVAKAHPEMMLGMASIGWFAAAKNETDRLRSMPGPDIPTLCLLGTAEKVVAPEDIRAFAQRTNVELVEIEGGLHELLIEAEPMRAQAWKAIDRFLAEQGLPNASGS
ncbi:MAG: alpha/beta fold hydrolase [Paracoccaceae bacterium]